MYAGYIQYAGPIRHNLDSAHHSSHFVRSQDANVYARFVNRYRRQLTFDAAGCVLYRACRQNYSYEKPMHDRTAHRACARDFSTRTGAVWTEMDTVRRQIRHVKTDTPELL